MATLALHSVSISFGKRQLLKQASLIVQTGEIIGLLGSNGSGKSTLLKAVFGTVKANSIAMTINEKPFSPFHAIRSKQIGYLPQHPFIPRHLKVRDLIPIYFQSEADQDKIFYDPLIATIASKSVKDLSFGQRRYLEVVLIIHLDRKFILLDEPFSSIEPQHKERLKSYIKHLGKEKGFLITDHYFDDVVKITRRNYLIKNGQLQVVVSKQVSTEAEENSNTAE